MYTSTLFKQDNPDSVKELIRTFPLSTLITHTAAGIEANHIPLLLTQTDHNNVLHGHIAKANPLWQERLNETDVLVIFNGPNAYVSPGYYPEKNTNPNIVPTWNYVTVHVKGRIRFIHDNDWKLQHITQLTAQHESAMKQPWSVSDAPESFIQRLSGAIVGLEIDISSMKGKWKLSQNKSEENRAGVISALSTSDNTDTPSIADFMQMGH